MSGTIYQRTKWLKNSKMFAQARQLRFWLKIKEKLSALLFLIHPLSDSLS